MRGGLQVNNDGSLGLSLGDGLEVNENGEIETKPKKLKFIEEAFTMENGYCIAPNLYDYDFIKISNTTRFKDAGNGAEGWDGNQLGDVIIPVGQGFFNMGYKGNSDRVSNLPTTVYYYKQDNDGTYKIRFYNPYFGSGSYIYSASVKGIKIE